MAKQPRNPKVYLVTTPTGVRLIRAFSPAGAIKQAVGTSHSAAIATQDQLIAALAKGVKVEDGASEDDDEGDVL